MIHIMHSLDMAFIAIGFTLMLVLSAAWTWLIVETALKSHIARLERRLHSLNVAPLPQEDSSPRPANPLVQSAGAEAAGKQVLVAEHTLDLSRLHAGVTEEYTASRALASTPETV